MNTVKTSKLRKTEQLGEFSLDPQNSVFCFKNVLIHSRDNKMKRQTPRAIFKLKHFQGDTGFPNKISAVIILIRPMCINKNIF